MQRFPFSTCFIPIRFAGAYAAQGTAGGWQPKRRSRSKWRRQASHRRIFSNPNHAFCIPSFRAERDATHCSVGPAGTGGAAAQEPRQTSPIQNLPDSRAGPGALPVCSLSAHWIRRACPVPTIGERLKRTGPNRRFGSTDKAGRDDRFPMFEVPVPFQNDRSDWSWLSEANSRCLHSRC